MNTGKNHLKFVIYDEVGSPRGFSIHKQSLKVIAIILPLLFIFSITGIILFSNLSEVKKSYQAQVIQGQLRDFQVENLELQDQVSSLQRDINQFEQRILSPSEDQNSLRLFSEILGSQDLIENKLALIEYESFESGKKLNLNLRLLNNKGTGSLNGYLVVIQYSDQGMSFFPNTMINHRTTEAAYNKGDSFSVARFKNITASFPKPESKQVSYQVLVFNKTGDILVQQQLGPYDL